MAANGRFPSTSTPGPHTVHGNALSGVSCQLYHKLPLESAVSLLLMFPLVPVVSNCSGGPSATAPPQSQKLNEDEGREGGKQERERERERDASFAIHMCSLCRY